MSVERIPCPICSQEMPMAGFPEDYACWHNGEDCDCQFVYECNGKVYPDFNKSSEHPYVVFNSIDWFVDVDGPYQQKRMPRDMIKRMWELKSFW